MTKKSQSLLVTVFALVVLGSLLVGPFPIHVALEETYDDNSFLGRLVEGKYPTEPLVSDEGDALEDLDVVQPYEAGTRDDIVPFQEADDSAEPQSPSTGPFVDPVPSFEGDSFVSNSPRPEYNPPQPAPGEESLIVLLVYFTDLSNIRTSGNVSTQVFTTMDGYYREVSFNQTWITGTVAGWFPLSHDVAYYGEDWNGTTDDPSHDGFSDSWWLIRDAVQAADPTVDFSLYSNVMIVHAGNGQESSGVANDIWSVRWSGISISTNDGVNITHGSIAPELQNNLASAALGTMAHEFGHDLGLPDLYHYGHSGEDDFVYKWGLMASGGHNGIPAGSKPAHPMAFSKIFLGWPINVVELGYDSHGGGTLWNQEIYTTGDQVIKVTISPTEYYLVEVRSDFGYDAYLPSTGVLISYCDESLGSGEGIVRIQDAHPGTTTLSDAAYQSGESFISGQLHIDVQYVDDWGDLARITVMWKNENWISDQLVYGSVYDERNPDITSDSSGNLYVAFEIWNAGWGTYVIEVRKSSDGGRTWNWLFAFGSSSYDCFNPSIATDEWFYDTVFVVCELEISPTNHDIMGYAYNVTGGQFMDIDTDGEDDRYPCIASEYSFGSSNYQYVAYERIVSYDERDMVVQRSQDHGDTWSLVHQRGHLFLDFDVYCDLSITCTRGSDSEYYVYVSYKYGADYSTGYSIGVDYSDDFGNSWTQRWALSGASQEKHYTSIAAGNGTGTVVVGWHQSYSPTDKDVWIAYSTDNGLNWDSQYIAYSGLNETSVDVAVDGLRERPFWANCPYFHIVYRVGTDILYKRAAANRPNIWSPAETVNSGGSASAVFLMPSVTGVIRESDDGFPAIVWTDTRGSYDVYYSTRGGTATFLTDPAGLDITIGGLPYVTPVSFEWIAGMLTNFSAPSPQAGTPGVRYVFNNWTTETSFSYLQDVQWACDPYDATVVSYYDTEYYLTVSSAHGTPSGEGWYTPGATAYAGLDADIVAGITGERFVFQSWSGDASGTDYLQSNGIVMDGPKTATVNWQTQYYLTVTTAHGTPSGEGWYVSGTTAYAGLDTDIVAGITGERFVFQSWSGNASGTDYSQSNAITMDGPRNAMTIWQTQYYLTVTTAHGTPSGEGWYDSGATAYAGLNAGIVPGGTGIRYVFLSWSGDSSGSNYASSNAISMTSPKTALANWQTQYYLSISSSHGTPTGAGWYADSTLAYAGLDIGVVPVGIGEQIAFYNWSGDASGTDYSWSDAITMDSPKTATAVWQTEYYLAVNSIHGTPSGVGWYASGNAAYAGLDIDVVPVGAGEQIGFQSWSGNASGVDYTQSDPITMNAPMTAVAVWLTEYYLTVNSAHGTPSGEGWYVSGNTAYAGLDINAVPVVPGEQIGFQSWAGNASGVDYSQSDAITMNAPMTADAVWQTEYYLTVYSAHGTPSGEGWYVSGTMAYCSLDVNVVAGVSGERFVFQSWNGNASGTDYLQSDAINMTAPRAIWTVWRTQYRLTCLTDPAGLTPAPALMPSGQWFDNGTSVNLVAQDVVGYEFDHWEVDGSGFAVGLVSIDVVMDTSHTALACYSESLTDTTTTTTTTTTRTLPPPPMDILTLVLLVGAGAGVVVVIMVVVYVRKRRA